MMTVKTGTTVLVCVMVLAVGGLASATPVIKDWSSKGGNPQNKKNAKDTMYLVKAGDKITFSVKAEGAEKYKWQVNKKVEKSAAGNSFIWAVPKKKGIWEIHLKVTGGKEEAHQEWVVSTLSKTEAPDFFDSFTDMKCRKRAEKDPWDRPLPEWKVHSAAGNVSKGFIDGEGFDGKTESQAAYGTWKFRFRIPNGQFPTAGGSTYLHYYYIAGVKDSFDYSAATDGHHHAIWWNGGTCFHQDTGFQFTGKWRDVKIIRTPDGYFYTFLDGVPESRWPEATGTTSKIIRMRKGGPYKVSTNVIYADSIEIYKDKYFFPAKSARYEQYITNWAYRGEKKIVGGNWTHIYKPVKRTGVVIRGRGVRLKDVAEMLGKPSLFEYDPKTKTAVCRTNLVLGDVAELIIEGETLKIQSPKPGGHEFAVMYGSALRAKDSTITSEGPNYFTWRFTSTTHFGHPAAWMSGVNYNLGYQDREKGITPRLGGLSYMSLQTIVIDNSVVNNSSYMFFDCPHELRITNTKITNLHEVDAGEYSATEPESRRRKEFVRGKKGLWVLYKNSAMLDFVIRNVTISGRKHPLTVTFMVNNVIERLNIYDMDLANENIEVRHSCQMKSSWYRNATHYDSTLGVVNSRFAKLKVPTAWAWVVPKYYLDVKVVSASGKPVAGARVTVRNEVDDSTYPAENMAGRRSFGHYRAEQLHSRYRFFSYTPLRSTTTGADGNTPLPSNKACTMILADFVQDKSHKKEFKYTITVEKGGRKKIITSVNPGPHWYRPDPNKPTYTITAVLDGATVTEAELKKKALPGG